MIKLVSASILAVGLATSAMAQTSGSGTGTDNNGTGTGTVTGTNGGAVTTDPNTTNSTNSTGSNGMNDRCKDAAGNDVDNNTATGNTTSDMQNCNK
ncbi:MULTISPECIES: hypothetical protein [unclassified Mesorhizobium]|uniref:hypothetical protein n=1 Tax=unclassified Mesorhizobium TaxID=325217 RepID=UPI000BAF6B31|nr:MULTISPECIES: hypothetical protein [unclassified Mesorhizobium]TGT58607.1 hypothetical protein EN813_031640 [Mesorhizobium sp. M00.F.Ca.ET.170.01.1.1]AZO12073.1 hypothetical protein EJ074_25395 [Mesorhizobium sp. M3A.F.Ca.ET.080.04.2.1]PBB84365.1 hypothetical protein CK216_23590 [Mesorhizobium sp. WSM3876]RWB74791.1 MAG: hypothetical protein EOQ49_05250 [Mesorhizobium sp.]RWB89751.1 MAG: hypothetical protein EOQ52_11635 [Mesorhizobium sp.]